MPNFPPGGSAIRHLPGGGSYADYPDGLRYVISGKGERYIVTFRKATFYVGDPNGFDYLSRAGCLADGEQRCRAHPPENIKYTGSGGSVNAAPLPDGSEFGDDYMVTDARITDWLNPPQFPDFIDVIGIPLFGMVLVALLVGLIGGFLLWLSFPADVTQAINPSSTLRTDRNAAIFRGVIISFLILLPFVVIGLFAAHPQSGPVESGPELDRGDEVVVLLSMTIGLLAVTLSTWLRLQVARIWLAALGQLPWNVMRFLEEAHARGALRQAGAAYQFRHARLQEQLVARAKKTHPRGVGRVSDGKRDDLAHSGRGI